MGVYAPLPALIVMIVGCVTCIIGGLLYHFMPTVITSTVERTMTLGPSTDLYTLWETIPVPIYSQFYFFNYTNHEDFLKNWRSGVKPIVQQVGPYTYRQNRRKININWTEEDTVEYREIKTYHFIPEMSSGTEEDIVIIPNIPLSTISQLAPEEQKSSLKDAVAMINASPFINEPIGKLLFHGYRDALVDLIQFITDIVILPDAMFGFFYGKNNTDDGVYRIQRGNVNSINLGTIVSWNNNSKLPFWSEDSCNAMNGTDGSLFAPNIQKTTTLYAFRSEICRSVGLKYVKEIDFKGIKGYQMENDLKFLSDANMVPENECFCYPNASYCEASGILNLASCKNGAPVVMSLPHFLMGAIQFRSAIDGLNPNYDEHGTVVKVEPISGALLSAASRIQMNLHMRPVKNIPETENLPDIVLPLFWINESAQLTDEIVNDLHWKLYVPLKVGYIVPFAVIGVGAFLALLGILCSIGLMFKSQSHVVPLTNGENHVTPLPRGYINTEFKN